MNIVSGEGVIVEYEHTGNLDRDIAQLSQAPGLEWMADLKDDPNVDWQAVKPLYREWSEKQEGLSGPAAAVIAIAVVIATQQYQLGAALLEGTVLAASTTATAAANAGMSALISQATISAINNKGNPGDTFDDLASSDVVRSVAAAMLTAGLLNEAGALQVSNPGNIAAPEFVQHVQTELMGAAIKTGVGATIGGEDFSDSLRASLQSAGASVFGASFSKNIGQMAKSGDINKVQQLLAHALVGCVTGTIGGADCGGAATGAALGEGVADLAHNALGVDKATAAKMGRYAALASVLATADEALDVTYTNIAASNAISNNFLLPEERQQVGDSLEACANNANCREKVEEEWQDISKERADAFLQADKVCKGGGDCKAPLKTG